MKSTLRRVGLLAAVALMAACSGEPATAPASQSSAPASAPLPDLLGVLSSLQLAPTLQRTTPLASDITVTKTIGALGGTLSIPAAGVTVTVPAGALSSPTLITMTARAGSLLAYDFAPHGITFAKPLTFSQSLSGTSATLLNVPFLKLGYYTDPNLLGSVFALVSELINGSTNLLSWTFTAPINHFSGYVVACGRNGEE
jgi:photosystem II stability/assembly factor-like uncharacterized protein